MANRKKTECKLPEHFFIGCEGNLFDLRLANWTHWPLRQQYRYTYQNIETVAQLKATLRNGPYTWPGGCQMYFITSDGEALSFEAARTEFANVAYAVKHKCNDGWRVIGCDINYEDSEMVCAHTGEPIPAAYGD